MESDRRRRPRKRKPFSDLTNAAPLLHPSSPPSPPKSSSHSEHSSPSSLRVVSATGSGDHENPQVHRSLSASTPRTEDIPADSVLLLEHWARALPIFRNRHEVVCLKPRSSSTEIDASTQQRASGRKDKGKAVAVAATLSCPPLGRIRRRDGEYADVVQPKSFSVPHQKPKKKQRCRTPVPFQKPILPQDFVEKQRAYFAEIDAFELPEEVVSEGDLE